MFDLHTSNTRRYFLIFFGNTYLKRIPEIGRGVRAIILVLLISSSIQSRRQVQSPIPISLLKYCIGLLV